MAVVSPNFSAIVVATVRSLCKPGEDAASISVETPLSSINMDSLALFSMLTFIESEYAFEFNDQELLSFSGARTLSEVVEVIDVAWARHASASGT